MEPPSFIERDGGRIYHTPLTVKGQEVVVSSSSTTLLVGYMETMVFPAKNGEISDWDELGSVRYGFRETWGQPTEEDHRVLEKMHESLVAALKLLDRGVVYNPENSIDDVLWAVARNDYSHLK